MHKGWVKGEGCIMVGSVGGSIRCRGGALSGWNLRKTWLFLVASLKVSCCCYPLSAVLVSY